MSVLPNSGPARRRILTPYVMIWLVMASFALAYLALLGLRPHMFAGAGQSTAEIEQKIAQTQRDMERGLADLDPLRRTVGEVKMDVANLKIAAEEASTRDQVLMEKVAALESAVPAPGTPKTTTERARTDAAPAGHTAIPPTPTPNPMKAGGSAKPFAPPVGPSAQEQQAESPEKSAKVINGAASTGAIETGSIERTESTVTSVPPAAKPTIAAKTTAAQAAAKTAAKPQPVGVILAHGPSIDSLRLNWSILTDRHADAVRNLQPRYVVKGKANERTYGLVAGPMASAAEAQSLCKVMADRGLPCEVGVYRGNAL